MLRRIKGLLFFVGLLICLPAIGQHSSAEVMAYTQAMGIQSLSAFEHVLIYVPNKSAADGLWVDSFMNADHAFAEVLCILVVNEPKEAGLLNEIGLGKPTIVVDSLYTYQNTPFYCNQSVLLSKESDGDFKLRILDIYQSYTLLTKLYRAYK